MFKNFIYLFRFNPRAVRKAVWLEIIHGLLVAAPTGFLLFIVRELLHPSPDSNWIWNCIFIMLGLTSIQFFVASKSMLAANNMVYDLSNKLRIRLGNHLQKLSLGYYKQRDPGDIASVILQDVANFEMIFAHSINNIAAAVIGTTATFLFLVTSDWRLALILIVAAVVVFPMMIAANYFVRKLGTKQIASRNATGARFLEYVQGIRYIKAFGMTGRKFHTLENALDSFRKESIRMEAIPGPIITLGGIFFELFYLLMVWVGLTYFTQHTLTIPVLIAFLIIGYRLYEPLKILLVDYIMLRYMNISLERIIQVLHTPLPAVTQAKIPATFGISFEQVTFSYIDRPVLQQVSFHAKEKSMTALVGASGSGKTTITSLIARFWDVQEGAVKIGNVDVKQIPQDTLYHYISEVFQEVYLFDDTIFNNIKIGRPAATEEEVLQAAQKAQLLEFTSELPEGIYSKVGEGGNKLSGGQKQRISIARALLKDAPVVLLDEATASLDPENEIYIQQAIQELVKDKTVIVIAHKLATIKNAAQILVLHEGRIVESGDHASLMAMQGTYEKLWSIQQRASGWKMKATAMQTV